MIRYCRGSTNTNKPSFNDLEKAMKICISKDILPSSSELRAYDIDNDNKIELEDILNIYKIVSGEKQSILLKHNKVMLDNSMVIGTPVGIIIYFNIEPLFSNKVIDINWIFIAGNKCVYYESIIPGESEIPSILGEVQADCKITHWNIVSIREQQYYHSNNSMPESMQ